MLSVGEEDEVTIKQVADAIVKAVGFTGDYQFDPTKADGQYKKTASNKKLMSMIGEFKFTPFEKGKIRREYYILNIFCFLLLLLLNIINTNNTNNTNNGHTFRGYCSGLAVDESVKWFIENYNIARK